MKKWTTTSAATDLTEQINRFFKGAEIYSVYEAGFAWFSLHRILEKNNIRNIGV